MSQFNLSATMDDVEKKFELYRVMLRAIAVGNISHTIVWGPPGVGKSYELEAEFNRYARIGKLNWTSSSGHVTACSLYNQLYEMSGPQDIVVFDDCDHVFRDRTAMNILKAATDTKGKRIISWDSTGGKPLATRFEYQGRVVVLSNADFGRNPHMQALVDRMFFIALQLNEHERVARVISVLSKPEPGKQIHPKADLVAAWIIMNHKRLGPKLTLRTAIKALQLATISEDWEKMAEMTVGV
jgi:hypothetical protein